ncbi:uncharacterized protein A1O9_03318 [Exophiala aquamarina CBS 119918]|uniref:Fcf2 pre-rRNA processing C-terminal domain-containing protein n=1 Tax=Exophiala aquamarina CBS 119918 TaxID=1182545 RepID=A0A072PQZ6_9EURO|nr:uncharacterized protein A1O9_03318 [Exophiala aquamarina CBS 119918]KEF61748.1 hypothetical protein A1O9_03318 [Exophiala aquamarina CBS 119918]
MTSEILSDAQIDQLLLDAEARLRARVAQLAPAGIQNEVSLETGEPRAKHRKPLPKLRHGLDRTGYLKDSNGVVQTDPKALVKSSQTPLSSDLRSVDDAKKSNKINDQLNAGPEWFGLPKTDLTPQLKRDLQLIEMRSVLDPHRHYKKNNRKGKIPTFSQTGTVIEGPTEFYSSRINKKDRTKNFVEEAIAIERVTGRFKRKYTEIQHKSTSGRKEHYKKLMAQRKKKH